MGCTEQWYEQSLQFLDERLFGSVFSVRGAEHLARWTVSAALVERLEEKLPYKELLSICQSTSINRTGWPFLFCDQVSNDDKGGVYPTPWGIEGWVDHSLGSLRLDAWELDARGAFHHSVTRGAPGHQKATTFRDLLTHPLLGLETISELFTSIGRPREMLYLRIALQNAKGLRLVHHDGLHQQAGPLEESTLRWEKYMTAQELRMSLIDHAADIYEKFRTHFGPATQSRAKIKEQLEQLLESKF